MNGESGIAPLYGPRCALIRRQLVPTFALRAMSRQHVIVRGIMAILEGKMIKTASYLLAGALAMSAWTIKAEAAHQAGSAAAARQ
jgi:hypothetical protein